MEEQITIPKRKPGRPKGSKSKVVLQKYDAQALELPLAKMNAVKNILRGKISLTHSCLSQRQRDLLVISVNAYLYNPDRLPEKHTLRSIIQCVIGIQHDRNFKRIDFFYNLIKQMLADGEKLDLEPLRIITQEQAIPGAIILNKAEYEKIQDPITVIEEAEEITSLRKALEAEKQRHVDFINRLIDEQKQASDTYFANYKPYKQVHNRRYDFEVKNQRKTNEEFIAELREVYDDDYDYTDVHYVNHKTQVILHCKKHDHTFSRLPGNLLKGWGCPHCNKEQGKTWANTVTAKYDPSRKTERWTTERFVQESINRFGVGVFDYSKVNYINNDTRVTIIRLKDGKEMNVFPYEHLRRDEDYDGEPKHYEGKTNEEKIHFLVRAIHKNLEHRVYVPYQDIPDLRKTLRCICPLHGEFPTHIHQIHNGHCCPECSSKGESVGERNVRRYLMERHIPFKQEHRIYDKAYFPEFAQIDFYLEHINTFIEFQGEQHYGIDIRPHIQQKKSFKEQIERDNAVRRYAADHGIKLIEIPYQFRNDVGIFLDKYKLV